ncbi:hypothetical protein ACFP8W_00105 [Nocardioides hankookensis]|uniref:Uncharacterized protein n=1 Tax=Nocardioides hankookensis TaxID=443157 RepID=A0ABW1LLV1_9ACTN
MDDQAALLARRVALAASAWLSAPTDIDVYRRLVEAVGEWESYCGPVLEVDGASSSEEELLDELADVSPPQPLGVGMADLEARLRRQAREQS